jgi:hypothetical protein
MGLMRFVMALLFLAPLLSYGADFKVSLPSWKMTKVDDGAVYTHPQHSEEMIITRTWVEESPDQVSITEENLAPISQARSWLLSKFGIGDYTILHFEKRKTDFKGFKVYDEIQAVYTGLNGETHQLIERQYAFDNKIYQVIYSVQANAINDHAHVDVMLDQLRPLLPAKTPASVKEVAKAGHAVKCTNCSSVPAVSEKVKSYDMSSTVAQNICKDVPIEQRRTSQDSIWENVDLFPNASCAKGVLKNAWGIVKGVGQLGVDIGKYGFNSKYRSQVNASIALIHGEASKDPIAFNKRILSSVFHAAGKAWDQFPCYKPQVQGEIACEVASNLIPAGLMGKVLTGTKLTAKEAAAVAKMTEAAAKEAKVAEIAKPGKTLAVVKTRGTENLVKAEVSTALQKGEDLQREMADFASQQVGKIDRTDRVADFIAEKMKNEGYSLEVLKNDENGLSSYHLVKKTPEGEVEAEIPAMVDKRHDFVPVEAKRIINSLKQRHGLTQIHSDLKDAETYQLKASQEIAPLSKPAPAPAPAVLRSKEVKALPAPEASKKTKMNISVPLSKDYVEMQKAKASSEAAKASQGSSEVAKAESEEVTKTTRKALSKKEVQAENAKIHKTRSDLEKEIKDLELQVQGRSLKDKAVADFIEKKMKSEGYSFEQRRYVYAQSEAGGGHDHSVLWKPAYYLVKNTGPQTDRIEVKIPESVEVKTPTYTKPFKVESEGVMHELEKRDGMKTFRSIDTELDIVSPTMNTAQVAAENAQIRSRVAYIRRDIETSVKQLGSENRQASVENLIAEKMKSEGFQLEARFEGGAQEPTSYSLIRETGPQTAPLEIKLPSSISKEINFSRSVEKLNGTSLHVLTSDRRAGVLIQKLVIDGSNFNPVEVPLSRRRP